MSRSLRYDVPSGPTAVDADLVSLLSDLPSTPTEICQVAQGLVVLPDLATGFGIPDELYREKGIRSVSDILRRLTALDDRPLDQERELTDRIVGTCRHFAVLSCAFLRHRGIAARARCGFATYFVSGSFVDHWIVEHWHAPENRWVRVDPEILGFRLVPEPDDLTDGEFLSGSEAWILCRRGSTDPERFGVDGVPHAWGIAEVRGNAIRDLAALNKVEMLPWDEWGRMRASYDGRTGPDFDDLLDTVAATTASDDLDVIAGLYTTEDLAVPPTMLV